MPMQERVQLARALADKLGKKISAVEDWQPLLRFTQGNPLTITVVAGQALRDGIETKAQVYAYLEKLGKGEQVFADETSEGRSKSLGASLSYGFETAFSEEERKILALLHFFQGFANAQVLRVMLTDDDWGLGYKDFKDQKAVLLLNKAAEIGLLSAHGGGYYTIHPALPWFFRELFEQYYPAEIVDSGTLTVEESLSAMLRATRAYVEFMSKLGHHYHDSYYNGNRETIIPLRAEEANLLYARQIACKHGWYWCITGYMQGLRALYDHTGRRVEWKCLVEEVVPDFVDKDNLSLPGKEEGWRLINDYRVDLAKESHDWKAAELLQRNKVNFCRDRVSHLITRPIEELNPHEKHLLFSLGSAVHELGRIQLKLEMEDCVELYNEAWEITEKLGDTAHAGIVAYNLADAYQNLPALRNLDKAERWYQRDFELSPEGDGIGRSKCLLGIGIVAHLRFMDTREEGGAPDELLHHLNNARDYYYQALSILPPDAVDDLASVHHELGLLYSDAGDVENAIYYYNLSI